MCSIEDTTDTKGTEVEKLLLNKPFIYVISIYLLYWLMLTLSRSELASLQPDTALVSGKGITQISMTD